MGFAPLERLHWVQPPIHGARREQFDDPKAPVVDLRFERRPDRALRPVDVRRVSSAQTAQEVGAEQIKALAKARAGELEALDIIAADGNGPGSGPLDVRFLCDADIAE